MKSGQVGLRTILKPEKMIRDLKNGAWADIDWSKAKPRNQTKHVLDKIEKEKGCNAELEYWESSRRNWAARRITLSRLRRTRSSVSLDWKPTGQGDGRELRNSPVLRDLDRSKLRRELFPWGRDEGVQDVSQSRRPR